MSLYRCFFFLQNNETFGLIVCITQERSGSVVERRGSVVERHGSVVERHDSVVERRGSVVERRGSVVVSTSAWHAAGQGFDSRTRHVSLLGVKSLALNIRDFISVSFGGDTKSRRSLLSGVYARGSKRSHTGGKQTDPLSWTPHLYQPLLC